MLKYYTQHFYSDNLGRVLSMRRYRHGKLHSLGRPSIVWVDGELYTYLYGRLDSVELRDPNNVAVIMHR